MERDLILGVDVGSTSVKAGVLDGVGTPHFHFAAHHPTSRPGPGQVEQDADAWVALVDQAIAGIAAAGLAGRIGAIGLCSQVNTHVFLDHAGTPLMPAILWQDVRAAAEAAELDAAVSPAQKIAWWGAPMPIDASHVLARMLWVARHRPAIWERTHRVVLPKDYCVFRLTGQLASDPISNIGLVDGAMRHIPGVLALVPGAAARVAPLLALCDNVGEVRSGTPLAGTPVINATMDGWTALIGAGGARQGAGVYVSGTSEILGLTSDRLHPTPGVIVFPQALGLQVHAGPTQSGGAAKSWFGAVAGIGPEAMAALVAGAARAADTPLFLPHLQGERAPLWNSDLRGVFLGLSQSTTLAHMARAVYEGVAFSAQLVLRALEASAGSTMAELSCGGGGFRADVWNQIRADVLGLPLNRLAFNEPGILGAVALAALGHGLYPDLAAASRALVHHDRRYDPDPARRPLYDDLFALYQDTITANAGLNARLLAIGAKSGES